jgi:predicted metal-dependent phosphoesterase TrpH
VPVPDAAVRHPHLADPLPAGQVRVDLHLHTMWSGDSQTTPAELADAVAATGLDVLCITDHSALAGAIRLRDSGELGCRVVAGQELRTAAGEIIGLFLSRRIASGLGPEAACEAVRAQGGIVYIPHPFDELRHALGTPVLDRLVAAGLVDAVEVFNAKAKAPSSNRRAAAYAAGCGLAGGAGSDSHEPSALGAAYVEMPDFDGPSSFLSALREATVHGHLYDAAREWRPRIVPSITS